MPINRSWLPIIPFLLLTACGALPSQAESMATSQPETVLQVADTSTPISNQPPTSCSITQPPDVPFTPPTPYPSKSPYVGQFWYGTPELWTMLRADGIWSGLPHNSNGYTQKIAWWRQGYDMYTEPTPNLIVTGKRLDESAPPLLASDATNASADLGDMMMVGVDIPTLGCWEIKGQYYDHELSFIVWVAP
jgi:hypothetical protein